MSLTAPVESNSGRDDRDPSQNGDDRKHHGVAAQAASAVNVALLQAVAGLEHREGRTNPNQCL